MTNPIATIKMSSGAEVKFELYPECAPNTVNSFIYLAKRGLFDNREIKRIHPKFLVQPSYTSFDDPECKIFIDGEFTANGFNNPLLFKKGTVAMGGDGVKIASGSCFYFAMSDDLGSRLDGKFPAFGKVLSGIEELERIENLETTPIITEEGFTLYTPVNPEVMEKVTVETFGIEYPKPITVDIPE